MEQHSAALIRLCVHRLLHEALSHKELFRAFLALSMPALTAQPDFNGLASVAAMNAFGTFYELTRLGPQWISEIAALVLSRYILIPNHGGWG